MSAKYICDRCKKKMNRHQPEYRNHDQPYENDNLIVQFVVNYGTQDGADVCTVCALDAIFKAAAKLKKWTKEQRRREAAAEKTRKKK